MTVILYKPMVGDVVNCRGAAWRIAEVWGDYSPLPGGKGKANARLEQVASRMLTSKEIAKLGDK